MARQCCFHTTTLPRRRQCYCALCQCWVAVSRKSRLCFVQHTLSTSILPACWGYLPRAMSARSIEQCHRGIVTRWDVSFPSTHWTNRNVYKTQFIWHLMISILILLQGNSPYIWTIIHCLGLGLETMACAACVFIFLYIVSVGLSALHNADPHDLVVIINYFWLNPCMLIYSYCRLTHHDIVAH